MTNKNFLKPWSDYEYNGICLCTHCKARRGDVEALRELSSQGYINLPENLTTPLSEPLREPTRVLRMSVG